MKTSSLNRLLRMLVGIIVRSGPPPTRSLRDARERPAAAAVQAIGWALLVAVAALPVSPSYAAPLGTAVTYQGRLTVRGVPANGPFDLRLTLFDSASGGVPVGPVLTNSGVLVSNGLFTTLLDFGAGIFSGSTYWLDVAVRPVGPGLEFGPPLLPRQPITATPYALFTPNAGTAAAADVAATALAANSVPWSGVIGVPPDLANGDDDTLYTAGPGLMLSGTQFSIGPHSHSASDLTSGILADARLGGTYSAPLHFSNPSNTISGNGAGLTALDASHISSGLLDVARVADGPGSGLDADLLDGRSSAQFWQLGGNAGTVPGPDFVGTIDNTALVFKVDGLRALRLEPQTNAPNIIAGDAANFVSAGVAGAGIGGGRDNGIDADFAHIGGGKGNQISTNGSYAVIPGGFGARAGSYGQLAHASGSFFGPGDAQTSVYVLRATSESAVPIELALGDAGQRMILPPRGHWIFDVLIIAATTNNASAGFQARGVIRRPGSTAMLVGTAQPIPALPVASTGVPWSAEVGAAGPALVIRVTGTNQPVRWVATVRTAELIF